MHPSAAIRTTRAEIDLAAVARNARAIGRLAGVPVCAVLKADAYGHGARAVAVALARSGAVAGLAVSLVEEGIDLRDAGVALPILVMGPSIAGGYDQLVARDLTAMISNPADLEPLAAAARRRGARAPVHLKIDTGMGRLGVQLDELAACAKLAARLDGLDVAGLCTHLACAETDAPDDPDSLTARQLARLSAAGATAREHGLAPRLLHAANSAATLRFPAARLDMVRCGIALYGNGEQPAAPLAQAMRVVTTIAQIRDVAAGQTVSYGALWRAPRASRLAVLPVGYADGLPRRATNAAQALIRGRRCPLVGAISMDIAIADVTALGDAPAVGDEAVLLGAQGDERIAAAELARAAGVVEYEVTCGISRRVPRVHVGADEVAA